MCPFQSTAKKQHHGRRIEQTAFSALSFPINILSGLILLLFSQVQCSRHGIRQYRSYGCGPSDDEQKLNNASHEQKIRTSRILTRQRSNLSQMGGRQTASLFQCHVCSPEIGVASRHQYENVHKRRSLFCQTVKNRKHDRCQYTSPDRTQSRETARNFAHLSDASFARLGGS